ncbi:MAG TPA: DUF6498-containing protein [bacterium]
MNERKRMQPGLESHRSENPSGQKPQDRALFTGALIGQSLTVLLTNAVPLYGVFALGWNSFALVLLFVLEGVIVLCTDGVKRLFMKPDRQKKGVLFFECVFIVFFGFFALMVFGPAETEAFSFADKFHLIKSLFVTQVRTPLLVIALFRLVRLGQDLSAAGWLGGRFRRPLEYAGGGWMLLLFFAVMTAPFISKTGPNPTGGLAALVAVKTLGELFAWTGRIVYRRPGEKAGKSAS